MYIVATEMDVYNPFLGEMVSVEAGQFVIVSSGELPDDNWGSIMKTTTVYISWVDAQRDCDSFNHVRRDHDGDGDAIDEFVEQAAADEVDGGRDDTESS